MSDPAKYLAGTTYRIATAPNFINGIIYLSLIIDTESIATYYYINFHQNMDLNLVFIDVVRYGKSKIPVSSFRFTQAETTNYLSSFTKHA
ncbi:MAG: hypothetical protein EKK57_07320 [Proteobacteria bacterium]|nr:MAG: hypothetical protein EKK57_07320 [Pseudomonadota bacterium]